jgi:hypothetical protein
VVPPCFVAKDFEWPSGSVWRYALLYAVHAFARLLIATGPSRGGGTQRENESCRTTNVRHGAATCLDLMTTPFSDLRLKMPVLAFEPVYCIGTDSIWNDVVWVCPMRGKDTLRMRDETRTKCRCPEFCAKRKFQSGNTRRGLDPRSAHFQIDVRQPEDFFRIVLIDILRCQKRHLWIDGRRNLPVVENV